MTQKKLHPNVIKFKEFVKKYPQMGTKVKSGALTWQELYEDWYLLGEEDPRWEEFKDQNVNQEIENKMEEKKSDFMSQVFDYLKTMDINQMQQHINQVSNAIGALQGVLSQFQTPPQPSKRNSSGPTHPFSFRKD